MKLNDYVKFALAEKKITIKDAAELLGYAEQSFRNKLSKNNLNLHDLVIISMLIHAPLTFTDNEGIPRYEFDKFDFLTEGDLKRLQSFMIKNMQVKQYDEWFTSLPDENKQEIYKLHSGDTTPSEKKIITIKKDSGVSVFAGIHSIYYISGADHPQALQYIMEYRQQKKRMSVQEEKDLINAAQDRFNVFIHEDEKPKKTGEYANLPVVREEPQKQIGNKNKTGN